MSGYDGALQDVAAAQMVLQLRRAALPAPNLPVTAGSPAEAALSDIRRRYTMQSERDLHDALIGPVAGADPHAASQSVGKEATGDDLDDIFF
jgi:hypothetical protein